jgi:hypothetical protein
MRVVEGGGAIVGFATEQFNVENVETHKSTAWVRLGDGTTDVGSAISQEGKWHYHPNHLRPLLPKTKPYDLELRCGTLMEEDMPQLRFNKDGVWHDFAPEGRPGLKAGPWFPYLMLSAIDRLVDHRVQPSQPALAPHYPFPTPPQRQAAQVWAAHAMAMVRSSPHSGLKSPPSQARPEPDSRDVALQLGNLTGFHSPPADATSVAPALEAVPAVVGDANEVEMCVICYDEPISVLLVHANESSHLCVCVACSDILKANSAPCPICREGIICHVQTMFRASKAMQGAME